mgnify:CR=1 FL=1
MEHKTPDGEVIADGDSIALSIVLVATGMVKSHQEFKRKLREGAIRYSPTSVGEKPLREDVHINLCLPNPFHEVRLGKRVLGLVVPR